MKLHKSFILWLPLLLLFLAYPQVTQGYSFTDGVEKVVLDNGLTILLKDNPAFDIVAVSVLSKIGSIYDPEEYEGLTYLTQRNLLSGTDSRSAREIVIELESLGVQLQAATSYDYAGVLFQSTPASFYQGLEILTDILTNPTFPTSELERERNRSLESLRSLGDDPFNQAVWSYFDLFYSGHPYSYPPLGTETGLTQVAQQHLLDWHKYMYQPEHLVISVVGNIETEQMVTFLTDHFATDSPDFTPSLQPRELDEFTYPPKHRQKVINQPTEAAILVMGYPAPASFHQDNAAMAVINSVLGGGMSSRLFTEVRDKRGLAYTAMSDYEPRLGPSTLLTFLATHPQNVDQAREQVLREIARFAQEGLPQEEIDRVALQKQGNYLMQNETNLNQGMLLGINELTGRGYQWLDEYINLFAHVSPEDIKQIAHKYFEFYTEVLITP